MNEAEVEDQKLNKVSNVDSERNMEEDAGEEKENREIIYLTKEYMESGDVEDSEEREIATLSPARIVRCRVACPL